jgi:hypothetical protein
MKSLILAFALLVSSKSIASITCDTTNRLGIQGKIIIELSDKTILLTEEGENSVIFDQLTVCGSSIPGSSDLDCPFITQENDSNLISDLRCFLNTETSRVLVVSGRFTLNKRLRSGSFKCSVYSNRGIDLKLSNCNQ